MRASVKQLPTLTKAHLVAIIKQFRQFPPHVRESCWIFLLALPCNGDRVVRFAEEFRQHQTGAVEEVFITSNDLQYMLHEVYPIASQTLKNRLEKTCLALYRWSPCLAQCVWLPKFVFPFIKYYGANTYLAFETCVCLLKSFEGFVVFRNCLPTRELCVINCLVENFFHLPNQQRSRMSEIEAFNQNHPCLKNLQAQSKYVFALFCSFFTEVLSGDEWLRLVDHVFLNQNVLFIYIVMAVFTAREMSLQFNGEMREKHIGLEGVDGILRVAYQIYDRFNHKGNADPYQDQPFVVAEQQSVNDLEAIEDFDREFPQKQIVQVQMNLLPDQIIAPQARIRDLASEVADVASVFGRKYDVTMRASYEQQRRLNQSVAEVQEEKKHLQAIQDSILRGDHLKSTSSSVHAEELGGVLASTRGAGQTKQTAPSPEKRAASKQQSNRSHSETDSASAKLDKIDREIDMLQRSIHAEQLEKESRMKQEEMGVPTASGQLCCAPGGTAGSQQSSLLKTQADLSRSKQMGKSAQEALLKRITQIPYPADYQQKSGLRSGSSHGSGIELQSSDGILRKSGSSSQSAPKQAECFLRQEAREVKKDAEGASESHEQQAQQKAQNTSHVSFEDAVRRESSAPVIAGVIQHLPPKNAFQKEQQLAEQAPPGVKAPEAAQPQRQVLKPWQQNMKPTQKSSPKTSSQATDVSAQIQEQREQVEKRQRELADKVRRTRDASAMAALDRERMELRQREIERQALKERLESSGKNSPQKEQRPASEPERMAKKSFDEGQAPAAASYKEERLEEEEGETERLVKRMLNGPEPVYLEDFDPQVKGGLEERVLPPHEVEEKPAMQDEKEIPSPVVSSFTAKRTKPRQVALAEQQATPSQLRSEVNAPAIQPAPKEDENSQKLLQEQQQREEEQREKQQQELQRQIQQQQSQQQTTELAKDAKRQQPDKTPSSQRYDAESFSIQPGLDASRTEPSTLVPLIPGQRYEAGEDTDQKIAQFIHQIKANQSPTSLDHDLTQVRRQGVEQEVLDMLQREKAAGRLQDSATLGQTRTEISYVGNAHQTDYDLHGASQTNLESQIAIAQVQEKVQKLQKTVRSGLSQDVPRASAGPSKAQIDARLNAVRRDAKDISGQLDSVYTDSSFLYNVQRGQNPLIDPNLIASDGTTQSANAASYSSQDLIAHIQTKKHIDPLSPCDSTPLSDHEELVELIRKQNQ